MTQQPPPDSNAPMRLQRFLSMAGLATRRQAEEMIEAGKVRVNGKVARLGDKVSPGQDRVVVGRKSVSASAPRVYLALNKPRGIVCTRSDPEDRQTVMELIPRGLGLVLPVGRLDYQSSGLLLLTNDGDLAYRLMRPESEVPKRYRVKAARPLADFQEKKMRDGLMLEGRRTRPAELSRLPVKDGAWYEVVLTEGKNRQIRKMFEMVGNRVQKLARLSIGPVSLGSLKSGKTRPLTTREVQRLRQAVGLEEKAPPRKRSGWAIAKSRRKGTGKGSSAGTKKQTKTKRESR